MKEVEIISKVVGRTGTGAVGVPSVGGIPSVDLSGYLLTKVWDEAFELKETTDGTPYLYGKLPVVVQYGITMYGEGGDVNIPSIYAGLPIDGTTIYWDGGVLKAKGGTEGAITDITSSMVVSALGYTPAKASDLTTLQSTVNDFLSGSDTDDIINKWKELEAFLSGLSESDNLATILGTKADKTYVDNTFVTFAKDEKISGIKTFTNGIKIGASNIKQSQSDVVYIDANLVVRGGITMYAEGTVDVGTIYDGLPIDGVTIYWEGTGSNKVLKAKFTDGAITEITSEMVTSALGYTPIKDHQTIYGLTIQKNGVSIGTYTPNSGAKVLNLTVPTKVSELYNDSSYATTNALTTGLNAKADKATTLAGYGITDAYTSAKVDELLGLYIPIKGYTEVTGEKNFTGGLKVNGSPIVYDATNKYWKLEGDLLVTGGVTMFASDSAFTPSTIMDAIATDGTNLKVVNGVLTFVGSIDGGEAGSVHWENVEGKPSFASVATSGKYSDLSGVPTLISSFTNDAGFITSYVDTKNTAGSTNTSSKIFLIGATSQAANPQTYSHDTAYVGTDGYLYSGGAKVLTSHQTIYNLTLQAGAFSAATFDPNGANKTVNIPTTTSHITEGDNLYYTNARAQAAITGGASTIVTSNLTANRALISNASGKVAVSAVTSTELGYLDGVTSAIQTQLDSKLAATSYTAADVLAKLLTVDGASSGLDADLLDGTHKSGLLTAASSSSATNLSITVGGTTKTITDLYAYKTTQLETARTIWGQSFDGTGNVSGALSGATTGAFSSNVTIGGTLSVASDTTLATKLTLNGIPIYKSQDDVLYIDGNLAVRGGITMYATDTVDVPSIIDSLPTASTSAKGLASFDPNFFSVDANGNVSFIGSTGITEVNWTDVVGRPTLLSSFINDQGFASTLGELANVGSWADSAPTQGRLLYQAKDSKVWTYKNVSDFVSENGLYLPLTGGVLTGNLEVTSITHSSPYATNIDKFGNLVFGSSGLDWSIKRNDQNKIVTLYNTGKLELNGRMGSDVPLTILSNHNQGLVIKSIATETSINYYAEAYGASWTTGINIKGELANSYCIYSATKNENVLKFKGSDGRGFVKFGMEFENTGLTTYATNGITIGSGDSAERYITCYGKNLGYINIGKSPSIGNSGEISFQYYADSSTSNYMNLAFYGSPSVHLRLYYNNYTQIGGNLLTTGGITMYSDIRKKTKLQDVELTLKQIANAPLIEHYYNSDDKRTTHVGSIAQYWAEMNDWFCKKDQEGFYTMEIQNAALASAISVARHLQKYETKTDRIIRKLKKRISELEEEMEKLKSA